MTDTGAHRPQGGLDEETRQMVVHTVRQLSKRLLTKKAVLEWDRGEIFPEAAVREMLSPEIGLQLLFIPEAYGGMGGGAMDCCVVTREMSKICLGVGTAFFAIQLGSDPIIVGGTEAQKQKWLGAVAEGHSLVAYAVTEAEAGSNLASLKTKAEPVIDASGTLTGYRINGSKQFISTGGYADFVTVLAQTPEGPTFFVVEKGTKGFEQHKGEEKHGIRASNTSPLTFTDVFVPAENLIGDVPGRGLKQANQVFGYTRLMVAAMALGAGEAALEGIAIPYAHERVQFGGPLSEKKGYTNKLIVPHWVNLKAAAAHIEAIARRLDSEDEDLQVEGSIAKLFTSEAANRAADDAMQALGGYGYISEFGVEKIKRDVKITCIYEGTSEIQQNIISTFRWKKTRKTKGAFYEAMASGLDELHGECGQASCRTMAACARTLNRTIDFAHENRLTRHQQVMFALADMMAHVEVGESMARLAVKQADETTLATARVFASTCARLVAEKTRLIVMGRDVVPAETADQFLQSLDLPVLEGSYRGLIDDMDRIADRIFERTS
ncbi:acyl-CoA dehydrogenase family protein [uncultured Desulfosarcina sp.]|uniref:acyl-CoA dehydrogenase family protein n=1 Tax=uncultured Desulfosarcina sp. TaxID=218289 RepID=UPI0029C6D670|nr:acyl-CoA dehydrogenase family protein [uncultured Desulfosarcina sp.]